MRLLLILFIFVVSPAIAQQTVKQSGTVTPGHPSVWITNGVIGDKGPSSGGGLSVPGTVGDIVVVGPQNTQIQDGGSPAAVTAKGGAPTGYINVMNPVYGAKCNLVVFPDAAITSGSTTFTSPDATFTTTDVTTPAKHIAIQGAGPNGTTLNTTIAAFISAHSVRTAATASSTVATTISNALSVAVTTPGDGVNSYAPGDTFDIAGGTASNAGAMRGIIVSAQVLAVSVNAGGTGGTPGTFVFRGLGGTPTAGSLGDNFVFAGTIDGTGALASVVATPILGGDYATLPSLTGVSIAAVTPGVTAPTGATVNIVTGALATKVQRPGGYTATPSNPASQGATSGSGQGLTVTVQWAAGGLYYYGNEDSAAFNAAMAAARLLIQQVPVETVNIPANRVPWTVSIPPNTRCLIENPVNVTGFVQLGVRLTGGTIECATNGQPCIDALGSRFVKYENIHIHGAQINQPSIWIQYGTVNGSSAEDHTFDRITGRGFASFTALYNFGAEGPVYENVYTYNESQDPYTYNVVTDGWNHWNAHSSFITVTAPVDVHVSCGCGLFIGGSALNTSAYGGAPYWLAGTGDMKWVSGYAAALGSTYCVIIYQEGVLTTNIDSNMSPYLHCEKNSTLTDNFYITAKGGQSTAFINGMSYVGNQEQPSNSVFKVNPAITSITVPHLHVNIINFFPTNTGIKLFDNAAIWNTEGKVELPTIGNWTEPPNFNGTVCASGSCINYVPTLPLNRNPDFVLDQLNEGGALFAPSGTAALIIDGWRNFESGMSGAMDFQQSSSSPPPGYRFFLSAVSPRITNPTSTQAYTMQTAIEGTDWSPAGFGAAGAQPFIFDFQAQATIPGTYSGYCINGTGARSYVFNFTITLANMWQQFYNTIPGDTGGTWQSTKNHIGIFCGFSLGSGTNFNTTPGTWQTGLFYSTSTSFNLTSTAGATLNIGAVHINLTGGFHVPYLQRPWDKELLLDQHWYSKSCQQGILCGAQVGGSGVNGAITFSAPYAFATKSTFITPAAFPVEMFMEDGLVVPTVTFSSTGANSANCYNSTQTRDSGAAASVNPGAKAFGLQCTLVSGDALGDQVQANWSADSGF